MLADLRSKLCDSFGRTNRNEFESSEDDTDSNSEETESGPTFTFEDMKRSANIISKHLFAIRKEKQKRARFGDFEETHEEIELETKLNFIYIAQYALQQLSERQAKKGKPNQTNKKEEGQPGSVPVDSLSIPPTSDDEQPSEVSPANPSSPQKEAEQTENALAANSSTPQTGADEQPSEVSTPDTSSPQEEVDQPGSGLTSDLSKPTSNTNGQPPETREPDTNRPPEKEEQSKSGSTTTEEKGKQQASDFIRDLLVTDNGTIDFLKRFETTMQKLSKKKYLYLHAPFEYFFKYSIHIQASDAPEGHLKKRVLSLCKVTHTGKIYMSNPVEKLKSQEKNERTDTELTEVEEKLSTAIKTLEVDFEGAAQELPDGTKYFTKVYSVEEIVQKKNEEKFIESFENIANALSELIESRRGERRKTNQGSNNQEGREAQSSTATEDTNGTEPIIEKNL
jgi:hypothetical protein